MDPSFILEVMKGFFTGAGRDMKSIPHTALSAILLWITVWVLGTLWYWLVLPKVTLAAEAMPKVQQLDNTMQSLQATLIVDKFERQLVTMREKIFSLQQEIERYRKKNLEVPYSMLVQLNDLTEDKQTLERKLINFTNRNASLLEPTL